MNEPKAYREPAMSPPPTPTVDSSSGNPDPIDAVLEECLAKLAAGDESARVKILEVCQLRLHELAHRLLGRKFSKVRRWDDTDDVAQNAALRLYRALAETVPDSTRGLMGLVATQIRRELIDLARKHSGPMSYAANHGTNVMDGRDGPVHVVDYAEDTGDEEEVPLERWEQFHAWVEKLPEDQREVFSLIWYLGVDQEAAAKALGCSLRTVSRRWQEAREAVRAALDQAD
jgi:RNA polymerase sigma factor (sigma-70 family)